MLFNVFFSFNNERIIDTTHGMALTTCLVLLRHFISNHYLHLIIYLILPIPLTRYTVIFPLLHLRKLAHRCEVICSGPRSCERGADVGSLCSTTDIFSCYHLIEQTIEHFLLRYVDVAPLFCQSLNDEIRFVQLSAITVSNKKFRYVTKLTS